MLWLVPVLLAAGLVGAAHAEERLAVIQTSQGEIAIEFFAGDAPNHVANFVGLAESGFYDGTLFHRIIPGFMIQGGDPNTRSGDPSTWGTGGPDQMVGAEFNSIKHARGIVSMARSADPDSAGSQFFIVHADSNFLDGQYTAFGRVVTAGGLKTLDRIAALETAVQDRPAEPGMAGLERITLVERSSVMGLLDLGEPDRDPSVVRVEPVGDRYENPELGVSFTAPDLWTFVTPRGGPAPPVAGLIGPLVGTIEPNISLHVEAHQRTFEELVASRDALEEQYVANGFEIISRERGMLGGLPTYELSAEGTITGGPQSIDLRTTELAVYTEARAYLFTYVNDVGSYDEQRASFEELLGTVEIDGGMAGAGGAELGSETGSEPVTEDAPADAPAGGGCLIATAAYGSELAPQVQKLRELRDGAVMQTGSGAAFMGWFNDIYYSFSPAVADLQREHPALRDAVRAAITPMIATLSLLEGAGISSDAEMITYGTALLLLNAGIYAGAPAAAALGARRLTRGRLSRRASGTPSRPGASAS
ncbi:MAG: peptidylprolyl isomerase [Nitrosopumilus sp.]|nr:peptidylprolyl isomerase [Nitrosopumilus sp.]